MVKVSVPGKGFVELKETPKTSSAYSSSYTPPPIGGGSSAYPSYSAPPQKQLRLTSTIKKKTATYGVPSIQSLGRSTVLTPTSSAKVPQHKSTMSTPTPSAKRYTPLKPLPSKVKKEIIANRQVSKASMTGASTYTKEERVPLKVGDDLVQTLKNEGWKGSVKQYIEKVMPSFGPAAHYEPEYGPVDYVARDRLEKQLIAEKKAREEKEKAIQLGEEKAIKQKTKEWELKKKQLEEERKMQGKRVDIGQGKKADILSLKKVEVERSLKEKGIEAGKKWIAETKKLIYVPQELVMRAPQKIIGKFAKKEETKQLVPTMPTKVSETFLQKSAEELKKESAYFIKPEKEITQPFETQGIQKKEIIVVPDKPIQGVGIIRTPVALEPPKGPELKTTFVTKELKPGISPLSLIALKEAVYAPYSKIRERIKEKPMDIEIKKDKEKEKIISKLRETKLAQTLKWGKRRQEPLYQVFSPSQSRVFVKEERVPLALASSPSYESVTKEPNSFEKFYNWVGELPKKVSGKAVITPEKVKKGVLISRAMGPKLIPKLLGSELKTQYSIMGTELKEGERAEIRKEKWEASFEPALKSFGFGGRRPYGEQLIRLKEMGIVRLVKGYPKEEWYTKEGTGAITGGRMGREIYYEKGPFEETTLTHEALHATKPSWSEAKVRALTPTYERHGFPKQSLLNFSSEVPSTQFAPQSKFIELGKAVYAPQEIVKEKIKEKTRRLSTEEYLKVAHMEGLRGIRYNVPKEEMAELVFSPSPSSGKVLGGINMELKGERRVKVPGPKERRITYPREIWISEIMPQRGKERELLTHELLHLQEPGWSEQKVREMTPVYMEEGFKRPSQVAYQISKARIKYPEFREAVFAPFEPLHKEIPLAISKARKSGNWSKKKKININPIEIKIPGGKKW